LEAYFGAVPLGQAMLGNVEHTPDRRVHGVVGMALVVEDAAMTQRKSDPKTEAHYREHWGMSEDEFWALSREQLTEIAKARGYSIAGIAKDGEYSVKSGGKDKRN
jgi:hypothetical protein